MRVRSLGLIAALALMGVATSASAYWVGDNYYGADDNGYGDVIASPSDKTEMSISGADAYLSGSSLTLKVYTGFAGNAGDLGFRGYTYNNKGLGYGDLFLSTGWSPYGSAPYRHDDAANGNHWAYGFALDDPFANGGSGTLYRLGPAVSGNNNPDVLVTGDFMSGAIYRNGQAVAVDTAGLNSVGSGTWDIVAGQHISFTFDIAGLSLDPRNLGFHWTMYCGNDVIEGVGSVPAPGTLALLGLGLAGLGFARKRKSAGARS